MIRELMGALLKPRWYERAPGADLSVRVSWLERDAEWRWHRANELNRRRGCPCGRPAEVAKDHQVTGTIAYKWWTCREHEGAMGFSSRGSEPVVALYEHGHPCPLGDVRSSFAPIGGPPDRWLCPHRTHEETTNG